MIVPLTPQHFRSVAEAHVTLDPTAFLSPVKEVGIAFRQKIFYPTLLHDPGSFVWLAVANGTLAGYIVGTRDVEKFYKRLQRFAPLLLFRLLLKAAFRKPGYVIKYAAYSMRLEETLADQSIQAEILSLGVRPQFRTAEFEQREGVHVANELFKKAIESFHRWGVNRFKVMTIQENKAANRFYEKRSCRLAGNVSPFGLPCNMYVGEISTFLAISKP